MGFSSNVVLTADHLAEVATWFSRQDAVVFDTEAMGENRGEPTRNQLNWISLASYGRAVSIPFGHPNGDRLLKKATKRKNKSTGKFDMFPPEYDDPPDQLRPGQVFEALEPLFFNENITKIAHNAVFDFVAIAKYYDHQLAPGPHCDTIVLQWLLNENILNKGLKQLTEKYYDVKYDKENVGKKVELHPFSKVAHYALMDARYTWLLFQRFDPMFDKFPELRRVRRLEEALIPVLCRMKMAGINIDTDVLAHLDKDLSEQIVFAETDVYRAAGTKFDLNSTPQKATKLFGPKADGGQGLKGLTLTPGGMKKKRAGLELLPTDYTTQADHLELFADNPLVDGILTYQELNKLHGTYVTGYLGDPNDPKRPCRIYEGKVHADFVQYGTVTGRFSCVSADALVETPRDMSKFPDGVPISEMKAGDWVYAFNRERELVLRRVKWVGQTGVKQTFIVTLENSEGHRRTVRLTPEHLVMLRNGDWRPAANLIEAPGEWSRVMPRQVMAMVRRQVDDGYLRFFPNAQAKGNGSSGGGRSREHRWIMSQILGRKLSTKYDVDHVDGNKLNNHPSNLRYLPSAEHRGNRELAWGVDQPEFDVYSGPLDYRAVSIVPGLIEPVWDMEVEDVHNFIANGVCVHNCREPNLQNVPRPGSENGKKIRGLFYALPGEKLCVADYGQIELVMLAHFCGQGALFDGFFAGVDPHSATAAALIGEDPRVFMDRVAKGDPEALALRQVAKGINFAIVFGAAAAKVASMAGITVSEAERFLKIHERAFPEIYDLKRDIIRRCRKNRYVTTLLGRRRRLPAIYSRNDRERMKAERQAVNAQMQGSAADLIKVAMVRLDRQLEDGMDLVLSVHDELVVRTPEDRAEQCAGIMRSAMLGKEIQALVKVPLSTDIKVVDRWADAK